MSRAKNARNDLIASSYAMGIRMSEIADQFQITRQNVYYILNRMSKYKMLRKFHWDMRRERHEQSRYRLCKGCGKGFIADRASQTYHDLACYPQEGKMTNEPETIGHNNPPTDNNGDDEIALLLKALTSISAACKGIAGETANLGISLADDGTEGARGCEEPIDKNTFPLDRNHAKHFICPNCRSRFNGQGRK